MKSKITLHFLKAHHAMGMGIINSMRYYHYSEDRPDSILFSGDFNNDKIHPDVTREIYALPGKYKMAIDYSPYSGSNAVPAKYAVACLDFLVAVTTKYTDFLYISKNECTSLLNSLVENRHLTSIQASDYNKKMPVVYDREDMEYDAKTNKDADLALKLAQQDKEKGHRSAQLYWLNQAKHFNSSHPFFATAENIAASLEGIESANIQHLFQEEDSANWLLDPIAACPTFKILKFDSFSSPDYINKTFVEFLIKSPNISELHMGSVGSAKSYVRMTSEHAKVLANALRLNKSVEFLDLAYQMIGDEGLTAIVDALIANPETNLKRLNIFCCCITERGATYLLENIEKIPSLRFVYLGYNNCSEKLKDAIGRALGRREIVKSEDSMSVSNETGVDATPNISMTSNITSVGMFSPRVHVGKNTEVTSVTESRSTDHFIPRKRRGEEANQGH